MADVKKTTTAAKAAKSSKPTKAQNAKVAEEVKTIDQLNEDLAKLRADYQESRRSHRMGELVNPHALTIQRKQVARALTRLNEANLTAKKEAN